MIDVDIDTLKTELGECIDQLFKKKQCFIVCLLLKSILKTCCSQFVIYLPLLANCNLIKNVAQRVCLFPNSEAGCEQSNSKYNRAKDKLGSRMDLDMIRARMRAGSNGPPLHLFNPAPVRKYWIENGHKVAEMQKSRDSERSQVITRIRKEETEKHTSRLFI